MKVILFNRMQPITNHQTSPLAILGQRHLTGLKIHSQSKSKITPPFCHKMTKSKTE
jgi:hypothetical protein